MRRRLFTLLWIWLLGAYVVSGGVAAEITVLHQFSETDGYEPQGAMVFASDGALYGTTLRGGNHGQGVVFKLSLATNLYQVLHHFSLDKTNGRLPGSSLVEGKDGALYGTTSIGGTAGLGTVFRIGKDGKAFTLLHSFTGLGGDGRVPMGGLRQAQDGTWRGVTDEGGIFGYGTLFALDATGTGLQVIHHFAGRARSDGEGPRGTLCEASDGKWYGTTMVGARDGLGTIFAVNGDGSGYRLLRALSGGARDPARPFGALLEGSDGWLYGTSVSGGPQLQGTVFRFNRDGSGFEVLRALSGLAGEGRNPHAGVVEGKDGRLYGVATSGGADGGGLVFRLARDGSAYQVLFAFYRNRIEGHAPYGALTLGPDGSLYGTTTAGTTTPPGERKGTVFRIRPGP